MIGYVKNRPFSQIILISQWQWKIGDGNKKSRAPKLVETPANIIRDLNLMIVSGMGIAMKLKRNTEIKEKYEEKPQVWPNQQSPLDLIECDAA